MGSVLSFAIAVVIDDRPRDYSCNVRATATRAIAFPCTPYPAILEVGVLHGHLHGICFVRNSASTPQRDAIGCRSR